MIKNSNQRLDEKGLKNLFIQIESTFNTKTPLTQWQVNPINTGLNNQLWHLVDNASNQQLVCRLTKANNPLTPNTQCTIALQKQLSTTQSSTHRLSAPVHHHSQIDGMHIIIMDFVQGTQHSANTWRESQRKTFAKQLAALHQTSVDSQLPRLDISIHLNDYLQRLDDKLAEQQLTHYRAAVNEIVKKEIAINKMFAVTEQQGVCHNDLNRLNIVYSPKAQQFILLDWDEARIGDCFFDLAGFTVEHQLTQQQSHQWLNYYFSERYRTKNQPMSINQTINKLTIYQQAYRLTCELWHHLYQPSSQ